MPLEIIIGVAIGFALGYLSYFYIANRQNKVVAVMEETQPMPQNQYQQPPAQPSGIFTRQPRPQPQRPRPPAYDDYEEERPQPLPPPKPRGRPKRKTPKPAPQPEPPQDTPKIPCMCIVCSHQTNWECQQNGCGCCCR